MATETDRALAVLRSYFQVEHMVEYNLKCGHTVVYSVVPAADDIVFCLRCDSYSVIQRAVVQFRALCLDCGWKMNLKSSNRNPLSRSKALSKLHSTKKNHTVILKHHDETLVTFHKVVEEPLTGL